MKSHPLLDKQTSLYTTSIHTVGYVKNSEGIISNIWFHVNCRINPADNSVEVSYTIKAFGSNQADYINKEYYNYDEAVDAYNEFVTKFDGYRDEL